MTAPPHKAFEHLLSAKLRSREASGLLRRLRLADGKIDFCSNDYLGFARSQELRTRIREEEQHLSSVGSTGSRLLTGHSTLAEQLERQMAKFHGSETSLLFNSGFDANVGLFSSIGRVADNVVYDELIHASVHDGMRLSKANCVAFRHNDPSHLRELLAGQKGTSIVAVESIYSMDGDASHLEEIVNICETVGASLIVDEAHAVGLFGQQGRGLVHLLGLQDRVLARLVTFGKSLGCHGAAVLGSEVLKQFLINHARPLIYSTFTSQHALVSVKCAYDLLADVDADALNVKALIQLFKSELAGSDAVRLIASDSAIQCLVVPGADRCRVVAQIAWNAGFDVRPIVAPTVPRGAERIRICLHEFNTEAEVMALASTLREAIDSLNAVVV